MKLITFFTLLIVTNNLYSQNFQGEIEYMIDIIPKKESINVDSLWAEKSGNKAKYLITSNLYKSSYFDKDKITYKYTYDNVSKRMYDESPDKPYITYRDSRKANFDYYGSKINRDSIIRILDKDCFMVKYESEYGNSTTYYSDEIKVDYKSFEGHKVGNWYEKLKEVDGCIAIKTITEFDDYYEIQEAVKITPMNLSRKDFEISPNKILIASYSALEEPVDLTPPIQENIQCYQEKIRSGQKLKTDSGKVTCYISFVVSKNGEIKYAEPVEYKFPEFNKIALDIIENCGLEFTPGKIEGRKVSSLAYFPIEF